MNKGKIAIIGGGIAGLTAAYLLNDKFDITLFEKDNRLGGNAYTHKTRNGELLDIAVAAYSLLVSQNFIALLDKLNVETVRQPTSSFLSIHNMDTNKGVYLTPNWKGLVAQKFGILRPKLLYDIQKAVMCMYKSGRMLDEGKFKGLTMAEAIKLIPGLNERRMVLMMAPLCLLSSMYYEEIMRGPAEYFFSKVKSFGQFHVGSQSFWLRFPKHLTRSYVESLSSHYSDKVVLNSNIKNIARSEKDVTLKMIDGSELVFDKVVFACNADQALSLIEKPTDEEKSLLGVWKYKNGLMVVHKDKTYFPKRELCQSWTCLQSKRNGMPHFSVSCCCWRLCPSVSNDSEYFSTQHPNFPIQEDLIDFQKHFRTPIFDFNSFPTINKLPSLNGKMNSYFCGSHFGFGLHDDAVRSAMNIAKLLGIDWQ